MFCFFSFTQRKELFVKNVSKKRFTALLYCLTLCLAFINFAWELYEFIVFIRYRKIVYMSCLNQPILMNKTAIVVIKAKKNQNVFNIQFYLLIWTNSIGILFFAKRKQWFHTMYCSLNLKKFEIDVGQNCFFYIFFTVKEFLQCHFVLENVKQMK